MRPVKLTMQAFGSYGKLTQIDFQEPNQNLFLVTGDTGAAVSYTHLDVYKRQVPDLCR